MTAKLLAFAGDKAGYLTPTEAAEWLPYTPKTIREMCSPDHPQLTHIDNGKTGQARRVWIHRDAIRAHIDRNTNHARSA